MSSAPPGRALRLVISGRVQGVGFRYFTHRAALQLGLVGWVKNLPDGQVEARVQGAEPVLELFCRRLREGPPGSRVDDLRQWELEDGEEWSDFQIRY